MYSSSSAVYWDACSLRFTPVRTDLILKSESKNNMVNKQATTSTQDRLELLESLSDDFR